eukprot:5378451-Pyramimonas_sp.AAC.1
MADAFGAGAVRELLDLLGAELHVSLLGELLQLGPEARREPREALGRPPVVRADVARVLALLAAAL